ncbi:hypothetical protein [Paenibacillus sp. MBLB4367]|uniref:hypothetical protein n=1 Tax=Paenibacillus sp. MBLB4367 TaxID=3384767 RepID=UPI0039082CC1
MKLTANERGSALLLALFLVFLVSILAVSLLTAAMQGYTSSKKGENIEVANYAAESGAAIAKRALKEAVATQKLNLGQPQVEAFVSAFNAKPLTLDHKPSLSFGIDTLDSSYFKLTSARTVGSDKLAKDKSVTLRFKLTPGSTGTAGAIFGKDVIAVADPPLYSQHGNSHKIFVTEDNSAPLVDTSIPFVQYKQQFESYFDAKMAERPLPLTPVTPIAPLNVPLAGYSLTAGNRQISDSPQGPTAYSGNITISNKGGNVLVVNGDLAAGGDIEISNNFTDITINGNMIAGGNIKINSYLQKLTVAGNIISGGPISFNGAKAVQIGGTISSKADINFKGIDDASVGLTVGGSILAETGIQHDNLAKLKVSGTISSRKGIAYSGSIGSADIGQSIVAKDNLTFQSIGKLLVGQNVSSQGDIAFGGTVNELKLQGGSIRSAGNLTFSHLGSAAINGSISGGGTVQFQSSTNSFALTGSGSIIAGQDVLFNGSLDNFSLTGSISSGRNVTFDNTISGTTIDGSIYAAGSLGFKYVGNLHVKDSMLSGSTYGNGAGFRFSGQIGNLNVDGTVLSKNKIEFAGSNKIDVKSFVGSIDTITFGNLDGGSGTVHVGGLTTGKEIYVSSGWKPPGGVVIDCFPPAGGTAGSDPQLEFGDWSTK